MARPITVSVTGANKSNPILLNHHGLAQVSFQVNVSGSSPSYTVESTNDDVEALARSGQTAPDYGATWITHPNFGTAVITSKQDNYAVKPRWIRLNGATNGAAATLTMTVIQAGLAGS